jgi:hypothetical protein
MGVTAVRHPDDWHDRRSWQADQLLEPTKLVFAIVIAESLSEYRVVLTSPFHHHHYIALLALIGIYLTTVWSWRGWHAAHLATPYKVNEDGTLPRAESWRFYSDLGIVIAYAYTLFQVAPLIDDPRHDIVWLLVGYPIIVALYGLETGLRYRSYGRDARRTIPVGVTLLAHLLVAVGYVNWRHSLANSAFAQRDLLRLNAGILVAALVVMWGYRRFNEYYKQQLRIEGSFFSRLPF